MSRSVRFFAGLIAVLVPAWLAVGQTEERSPGRQRAGSSVSQPDDRAATAAARPAQARPAQAQPAEPAPSPSPTRSDPNSATNDDDADDAAGVPLKARVIEVEGSVEHALGEVETHDLKAWKPVTLNMELAADTQVRTGMRSRCTLQFGAAPDETILQLRRGTLAKISDYRRTADVQRIRIGLGYGAVRGGSSEGTLRSDVVVDSTVATLAKRGTAGWEIEIEPIGGTFRISLARSGLIEAYSKAHDRSTELEPGEYVSNTTIARLWINQEIFDRAIQFFEPFSLTEYEVEFMLGETTGYSSLGNDASQLYWIAGRRPNTFSLPTYAFSGIGTTVFQRQPVRRPEGNFGFGQTFRVLVAR
jgi:hypothetical protein